MDDGGHDNRGLYFKGVHPQWNMIPQYQVREQNMMNRKIMHIAAERDAAVSERDRALAEKKAAVEERDIALQQRDAAIADRETAIRERDNAIAALHFHENTMTNNVWGCSNGRGTKRTHQHNHPNQHIIDVAPISIVEGTKSKRTKENPSPSPSPSSNQNKSRNKNKNKSDSSKPLSSKGKKVGKDLNRHVTTDGSKAVWDAQDLGLISQITFDESIMPIPICTCTGLPRQCYKWGSGGWQSSCCTTTLSVYPLPHLPNKRHSRMGGRKMSGSVFSRLLSRLAAQGEDLSIPVDLKNYWAKHGTNRYITIK